MSSTSLSSSGSLIRNIPEASGFTRTVTMVEGAVRDSMKLGTGPPPSTTARPKTSCSRGTTISTLATSFAATVTRGVDATLFSGRTFAMYLLFRRTRANSKVPSELTLVSIAEVASPSSATRNGPVPESNPTTRPLTLDQGFGDVVPNPTCNSDDSLSETVNESVNRFTPANVTDLRKYGDGIPERCVAMR